MRVTQREAGREIIVYNTASARAALYSCAGPTSVFSAVVPSPQLIQCNSWYMGGSGPSRGFRA